METTLSQGAHLCPPPCRLFFDDFAPVPPGDIAIISDAPNVYAHPSDPDRFPLDLRLTPKSPIRRFLQQRRVKSAVLVSALAPPGWPSRRGQEDFCTWARLNGWRTRTFELAPVGVNWEAPAAVDQAVRDELARAVARNDIGSVLLLSGDGGFANAVRNARTDGIAVVVGAWRAALNPALAAAATGTILLEDVEHLLRRRFV